MTKIYCVNKNGDEFTSEEFYEFFTNRWNTRHCGECPRNEGRNPETGKEYPCGYKDDIEKFGFSFGCWVEDHSCLWVTAPDHDNLVWRGHYPTISYHGAGEKRIAAKKLQGWEVSTGPRFGKIRIFPTEEEMDKAMALAGYTRKN